MSHEYTINRRWFFGLLGGLLILPVVVVEAITPFVPEQEDPEARAYRVVSPRQSRVVLPAPDKPKEQTWRTVPMTGGPAVYTACVDGDRLFAMNKTAWRGTAGLWPDVALTVSPGACKPRAKR